MEKDKKTFEEVSADLDKLFNIGENGNSRTEDYEYTVLTENTTPADITSKLFDYFSMEYDDIETGKPTYHWFGVKCTISSIGDESVKFKLSKS